MQEFCHYKTIPFKELRTEVERLNALRSYNILDTIEESDYDELTKLASVICQMPISLISLVDEKRQWFKSHIGLSAKQTPIEQSFCAHTIASNEDMMVVGDATVDERFCSNPLVTGDPNIVFYAGVPLINEDGFPLGTLCVIDSKRHELTEEQKIALRTIANQVVGKMELRRKNELLKNKEIVLRGLNEELIAANKDLHSYQENLDDLVSKLTQSESRSKTIIADAPVAIGVLKGKDMVIESANNMILEIWGKSSAVIGIPLADALPELNGQPFLEILHNVFTSGNAYFGTNASVVLERGGKLMDNFYNFVYQPIKDVSGRTDQIMVVANDVTEQVNASRAIVESERKFRSLIEQAAVAIIVFRGDELRIDAVNPRMQELLGKDGELMGKTLLEAVPELKDQKPYELLHKVYQTGETFNGNETPVTLIRNGQKEVGYFNFTYTPLIENGEVKGIIDMAVEVTEQVRANRLVQQLNQELASTNADLMILNKEISAANAKLQSANRDTGLANLRLRESEQSLQMLADNISQLTWMADGDGYIFWYNKRWYDYTGTSIEEMRGSGWHTIHHPEHLERVVEKYNKVFAEGELWEDLFPLRGKDGSYRWFLSSAVPLKDDDGNVLRWFGTNTDVTEQREDEQRKNDFIAMVSHELKTPLTSVTVLVQMLQLLTKSDNNPKIGELLDRSRSHLSKMNSMITGFLDVSRFEAGKIYLQNQHFSFGELVMETVADTQLTSTNHQITIQECPEISVTADRDKIGQVIYNLLSNAIKYSQRNSGIEVGWGIENGMAEFRISDNGMGIGQKDMEKLFERFYRVERQETKRITGFGIGLYLCAEIIHSHKGKIWVESEQGKGSTFYFAIPLTA